MHVIIGLINSYHSLSQVPAKGGDLSRIEGRVKEKTITVIENVCVNDLMYSMGIHRGVAQPRIVGWPCNLNSLADAIIVKRVDHGRAIGVPPALGADGS